MANCHGNVNPDLVRERERATFDPLLLTHLLYNGPEKTRRRRYLQNLAIEDPAYQNKSGIPWSAMSRDEKFSEIIRKSIHFTKQVKNLGLKDPEEHYYYSQTAFGYEMFPFGLHNGMFIPTIDKQGTEEQRARWLPLAESYQIIGTYAQTEMGHGTYIRGLETTATYDPKTQEFVLNSPTLTSTKFWPGNLGKISNYCVVLAQLYSLGKCHGLQSFLVQIRRTDNHEPIPGITLGDIGPKFGYEANDNGFLRFDNVRIPRMNMLMKYAKVLEDGTFIKPQNDKLLYGTMVYARAGISIDVAIALSAACTIAIRYSAVRRQTAVKNGEPETQVLDYQTQQQKLFPHLAEAYALLFSGRALYQKYLEIQSQIDKGALEGLPQLHALSAGMKAFNSWVASTGMEECRMSCGGHGYSQASGIPKIYVFMTPTCTYEGDNTVMMLQTARYLVKCHAQAQQGKQLPSLMLYLLPGHNKPMPITKDLELPALVAAYYHRAARLVSVAAEKLQKLILSGKSQSEAWNLSSVQLVNAASAHCHAFVVMTFVETVTKRAMDKNVRQALQTLCRLYAVHGIIQNLGDFVRDGYISGQTADMLTERLMDLLAAIRPNAVALVDAFDYPDQMLDSALGRYDGQVYEALYDFAKKSPFNKTEVHDVYHKYLKPFMESKRQTSDEKTVPMARL